MSRTGNWVPALVAAVAAGYFWFQWFEKSAGARLLAEDAVEVQGLVESKERFGSGGRRGLPRTYWLVVSFRDGAGLPWTAKVSVDDDLYSALDRHDPVKFRYAKADPTVAELTAGSMAQSAGFALVFASMITSVLILGLAMLAAYRTLMARSRPPS